MKNEINSCIYCQSQHLYKVSHTQYKCATCKKKFSLKKYTMDMKVIELFCDKISAKQASEFLHVNYKSIESRYKILRKNIIVYLESVYAKREKEFSEYEEYYYLPENKRGKIKYLFDAIPIFGMMYDKSIYTLMLPNQFEYAKEEHEKNPTILLEYAKFLNRYKIIHYEKFDNLLVRFWLHVENEMKRFHGVSKENFILYLKECEFTFNYTKCEQKTILTKLWFT